MFRNWFFVTVIVGLFLSTLGWGAERIKVGLVPARIYQGNTVAVYVEGAEDCQKVSVSFLNREYCCFPTTGKFRGLIGITPDLRPGKYSLEIVLQKENGSRQVFEKKLSILPAQFASTWFKLKPAKKKLYVRDLIQKEWAEIEKLLIAIDPVQYWKNKFSLPVKGPISMPFGTIEHINGKRSGQHRGLDLAVPTGTLVRAPENGKIVFAKMLKAFGGTMVIDHGQGVHSLYFHLSKILRSDGEMVKEGEIIALSGNTGISTGPHLHWGISVNNVRVDPLIWTKYAF